MNLAELRTERNARLAASDFLMLTDVFNKTSEGEQVEHTVYRQNLRDLPARYADVEGDIETVEWPQVPSALG
tara:strand:- start:6834 stop:7049 length:216 start_codon:yes stop_codon:yes gene_type:complete